MIGKFTTDDREEYLKNPSLIYFHPNQYATLKSIGYNKVHRCKYCSGIIKENNKGNYNDYCDSWCKEMGTSKHLQLCSQCYKCGINIPYQTKVCQNCKRVKKPKIKKERSEKYNVDRVGHTCKKCGVYKKLDEFNKNKNMPKGITYRCKTCCAITHKEYYAKNKKKIDSYRKEWVAKKKLSTERSLDN